jgi:hypothetical protein
VDDAEPAGDLKEARRCYRELCELFEAHRGGWADHEALEKVGRLSLMARRVLNDHRWREKLTVIEDCAAALFSERNHLRLDRGPISGAEILYSRILVCLGALEDILLEIEAGRRRFG